MSLQNYEFEYPQELVATHPAEPRSSSKLLCFDRASKKTSHLRFSDLNQELNSNDVLVLNQTKVMPARFFALKETGGKLEGLFFQFPRQNQARVWIQGKVHVGQKIFFDSISAEILEKKERDILLQVNQSELWSWLKKNALPALPPYIRKRRLELGQSESLPQDSENYQSLWACEGQHFSVAAPTASLHFDEVLLQKLQEKGVAIEYVSLHVGAGTFLALENENVQENRLHFERVEIQPENWKRIQAARRAGKKIIAVGSTATRALESAAIREEAGQTLDFFETDLFIYPPYKFKVVDSLITNFHQPRTSLLLLVDAFLGGGWKNLYNEAIRERYRLFSFGDAMWIR